MSDSIIALPPEGKEQLRAFFRERMLRLFCKLWDSGVERWWEEGCPCPWPILKKKVLSHQILDERTLWKMFELWLLEHLLTEDEVDVHVVFSELFAVMIPECRSSMNEPWMFACTEVSSWCKTYWCLHNPEEGL